MPSDPTTLCLACGLCCDGSLFRLVALGEGEADRLRARGLVVSGVAGREHVKQPCEALEGFTCRVYDIRPSTCRRYRCALLKAVESGEVEPSRAIALVQAQRGLVAGLVGAIGGGALLPALRELEGKGDASAGELLRMLGA